MSNHTPFYVSIDIKTTGLDPVQDQILEFAAVAWTNEKGIAHQPSFHSVVDPGRIIGDPYALSMNAKLIERIRDGEGKRLDDVMYNFRSWLTTFALGNIRRVTALGNNFASFDLQFLKRATYWPKELFTYRNLDIGSLYAHAEGIPSLKDICDAIGYPDLPGDSHQALYDAQLALWAAMRKL